MLGDAVKNYKLIVMIFVLMHSFADAAVFTVVNYWEDDITIKLYLDKSVGSWDSTIKVAKIPQGTAYRFDTGIYGVKKDGITWKHGDDEYYLPGSVQPLTTGLIFRIFASGTYEWEEKGSYINYLQNGVFPSGFGKILIKP